MIPSEQLEQRCRRTGEIARAAGTDSLLIADPATVAWLTGRQQEVEFGPPYPISAGTLVHLYPDGSGEIVVPEDEQAAGPSIAGLTVHPYEAYTVGELRPFANARARLNLGGTVGIEAHAVAAALVEGVRWIDVGQELRRLRAVKDEAEIAAIRRTCQVISAGQRAFRTLTRPGRKEIEVFSDVHAAMEAEAGCRVAVLPDLLSGPRLMVVGRPPTDRVIAAGELALCDLAARHDGHWADSCTTICVGAPTAEMRRLHDACRRTLDEIIATARPGAVAGDLDRLARSRMSEAGYSYPHHTGHGVGAGYHEEPRIVPGATAKLAAGMVLAFEPAGFGGGIGARVEHVVLIGDRGNEILTDYDTRLEQ